MKEREIDAARRRQSPWFLTFLASLPSANECWEWVGQVNGQGYGVAGGPLAHRRIYEFFYGALPDGMQVHHLCRNRRCVNPHHLRPIGKVEHGVISNRFTGRSHCSRGHEYTPENTAWYHPKGGAPTRRCRACKRIHERGRAALMAAG